MATILQPQQPIASLAIAWPLDLVPCCELCGEAVPRDNGGRYLHEAGWFHWLSADELQLRGRFAGVWVCPRHDGQVGSASDTLFHLLHRGTTDA